MEEGLSHIPQIDLMGSVQPSELQIKLEQLRQKPKIYQSNFTKGTIPMTLTFNDILLVPQYGEIESRYQLIYKDLSAIFTHSSPRMSQ